jgi:elongation factor G
MDEPALLSLALSPKTDADRERLNLGLQKLMGEDPALRLIGDLGTGEVVIAAIGELQLEVVLDRLKREFSVEAGVGRPQVAYKETFTHSAEREMKYAKQTDGRGQYAHAKIRLYPGESGSGYIFNNRIRGGAIPDKFIQSVNEGIKEALTRGMVAGYPVDDVRIELYDGSYHDIDSSQAAFKTAGAMAFQDAAQRAGPVLLEPVMRVEVLVSKDYVSDVVITLSSRGGRIQSREDLGDTQVISAHVPLSEMFGYSSELRERTRGCGTFVMRFNHCQPVRQAEEGGTPESFVRVPLRPSPAPRTDRVALPEPDGDTSDD